MRGETQTLELANVTKPEIEKWRLLGAEQETFKRDPDRSECCSGKTTPHSAGGGGLTLAMAKVLDCQVLIPRGGSLM